MNMSSSAWSRFWPWLIILLVILAQQARAEGTTFYLEVVLNGKSTRTVYEVIQKDQQWLLKHEDLLAMGLILPEKEKPVYTDIAAINGVHVSYDGPSQRLQVIVPPGFLPMQYLNVHHRDARFLNAQRDTGMLLNYQAYAVKGDRLPRQASGWHELRWFNPSVYLVSQGLWRDGPGFDEMQGYVRFDTYLSYDSPERLQTLVVGDVINNSPTWGRSIRMGGVRIARDYSLNPQLITYPIPAFYGETALPGPIELLVNDQLRAGGHAEPGPFQMTLPPYITGAGTATIVTTDIQGRPVSQSLNFYVASDLLAPGLLDYDLTFGYPRRAFGLESDVYDSRPVFSGALRYGVNDWLTPQVLLQGGQDLNLTGVGLTSRLWQLGVLELSYNQSKQNHVQGEQQGIAYSYRRRSFGFQAQHLQRSENYRDIGSLAMDFPLRRETQVSASYGIRRLGTLGAGYFELEDQEQQRRQLLNISWSRHFRSGITALFSANRQVGGDGEWALALALSMPIGESTQGSATTSRNAAGDWNQYLHWMRMPPYEGGVGWNLAWSEGVNAYRQAILDWRAPHYDLSVGVYGENESLQRFADLRGSLVWMDGEWFASREIFDSFAVVDTQSHTGVPVMLGHQLVGHSNHRGKLLVPDLTSFSQNYLSINPVNLPANTQVLSAEKHIVPARRAGLRVNFELKTERSAVAILVDEHGDDLPVSTWLQEVRAQDGRVSENGFSVGWNGEIYVHSLEEPLYLLWETGNCIVEILPYSGDRALPRLGPFACWPVRRE